MDKLKQALELIREELTDRLKDGMFKDACDIATAHNKLSNLINKMEGK